MLALGAIGLVALVALALGLAGGGTTSEGSLFQPADPDMGTAVSGLFAEKGWTLLGIRLWSAKYRVQVQFTAPPDSNETPPRRSTRSPSPQLARSSQPASPSPSPSPAARSCPQHAAGFCRPRGRWGGVRQPRKLQAGPYTARACIIPIDPGATMRLAHPRIPPLSEDDATPEQRALLDEARSRGGRVLNVQRTIARYPKLAQARAAFSQHVMGGSALPPREREILILRTGWLCQSAYEFGQHTRPSPPPAMALPLQRDLHGGAGQPSPLLRS